MSTRQLLRRRTARQIGLNVYKTGTAESSGSTTAGLQDDTRKVEPDDFFAGAHLRLTSGSPSETDLMVTSNTGGLLSFRPTLAAAPDSLTYELLPVSAFEIHNAIDDAFDDLHQRKLMGRSATINGVVGGSPAYNADFHAWNTDLDTPDGYTVSSGSVTRAQDKLNIGLQHMSTSEASTIVVDEPYRRFFYDMTEQDLTMYCWVWCDAASEARIGITLDGSTTWSSYHTGSSSWELLEVEVSSGETIADIIPTFATSGNNARWDAWWIEGTGGGVFEYPIPILDTSHINEARQSTESSSSGPPYPRAQQRTKQSAPSLSIQAWDAIDRKAGILMFRSGTPPVGHRMWFKIDAPFVLPDSDATVVNLTPTEEYLVAKKAAALIIEGMLGRLPGNAEDAAQARLRLLLNQITDLESGLTTSGRSARLPANFMST